MVEDGLVKVTMEITSVERSQRLLATDSYDYYSHYTQYTIFFENDACCLGVFQYTNVGIARQGNYREQLSTSHHGETG